ncbi:MAG: chemotaxis protein CheA [Kofleriaceae bacterium]
MGADEDILQEFLVEGRENLDKLERELVAFEKNGASDQTVSALFRTVHTVKGTAGFFGFERLQSLAHIAENLLSKVRDGLLPMSNEIVTALLAVTDGCRNMMDWVEQTGTDGDDDYLPLKAQLETLTAGAAAEPDVPDEVEAPTPAPAPVVAAPAPVVVEAAAPVAVETHAPAKAPPAAERADTTVRVDVSLLDKLMDLAGELVLARNQLLKLSAQHRDTATAQATQRLDQITSELQDNVMKTRMQPIGGTWAKLPRIVRDLAGELGKQVRLELHGEDTGLDRSILEAMKDPLTHIVRNACDHGIESPKKRIEKGKMGEGLLRLRASHEGGHVMIEIADDGAGIDPDRVKAKALERGIITPDRAAKMTTSEAQALVFAPGFSTAEKITNVSGRGVGMDVVKTNIERIGGTVEIESMFGQGTTLRIKIPLTLAIIPALIVNASGERYAVPQNGVLELVRIDPNSGKRVELVGGEPVYRLRGELLPLVYLSQVLGGQPTGQTIVVLQNEGRPFGLVVDAVQDTEEIVVKPTGKRLKELTTYSGATILGDGRVALILDIRGIATKARLGFTKRSEQVQQVEDVVDPNRFLIVQLTDERRVAVALDDVARLEEFKASALERAAGIEVMQYRNRMLPLVRLGDALGSPAEPKDTLHVIVYTAGSRDLGLVVDGIVDIVEESVTVETTAQRHGLFGSAIIDGRVTDIVDIATLAADMGIVGVAS